MTMWFLGPTPRRSRCARALTQTLACAALGVILAAFASPTTVHANPLFVDCRGVANGTPTVILEAGAFGTSADWDDVLDDLAAGGRVCAYDRAGLGRSAPGDAATDVLGRAKELSNLLDQLGEHRPAILVGHSNGALYVQAFARLWPERVAGLVYVNGVGADAADDPRLLADLRAERRASNLAVTAGHMGLAGLVAAVLEAPMALADPAAARKRASLTRLASLKIARDEDVAITPGLEAVRALGLEDRHIPTVAIIGWPDFRHPLAQAWRVAEVAPAARADRGWVLDMAGADHVTPLTRDRAYVSAAVAWLRRTSPDPGVGH